MGTLCCNLVPTILKHIIPVVAYVLLQSEPQNQPLAYTHWTDAIIRVGEFPVLI